MLWWLDEKPFAEYSECIGCKYRQEMLKNGECKMYLYMDSLACKEGKEAKDGAVRPDSGLQGAV